MVDFIGDATSTQLLILMAIPLTGAVILTVFLAFSVRRRRSKKTKMKLGIQPKEASIDSTVEDNQPLPVGRTDNVLSTEEPSPAPPIEAPTSRSEIGLNLDVLSSKVDTEAFDMDTPKQSNEEKIDLAARLGSQPPVAAQPVEPAELMRLLRHPQSGDLVVEIAGQRYAKLADVDDKEIGQYILELAAHLLVFTSGVIATEVGVKSVYLPKRLGKTPMPITAPTPVSQLPDPAAFAPPSSEPKPTPSEPELVPPPPPEAEAAFRASLQKTQAPQPEPQRRGGFGRPPTKSEIEALPGFNLADEINKIVQTRLMISPLASTTEVEILSDPSGGIRIDVDGISYSSPDDIPDPEVKALIKDSIKQWERS